MPGNWFDIETAPRDGTWFLAWDGEDYHVMKWEDALYFDNPYGFRSADWGRLTFTHWQPLPPPPEKIND